MMESHASKKDTKKNNITEQDNWCAEVKHLKFPGKLHWILEHADKRGYQDIISWSPCGTKFRIYNRANVESYILARYFPAMSSYKSFRRQLNLYGIRLDIRSTIGNEYYVHPLLIRGELCLSTFITRHKSPSVQPPQVPLRNSIEDTSKIEAKMSTSSISSQRDGWTPSSAQNGVDSEPSPVTPSSKSSFVPNHHFAVKCKTLESPPGRKELKEEQQDTFMVRLCSLASLCVNESSFPLLDPSILATPDVNAGMPSSRHQILSKTRDIQHSRSMWDRLRVSLREKHDSYFCLDDIEDEIISTFGS